MSSAYDTPAMQDVQYVALDANFADPKANANATVYEPTSQFEPPKYDTRQLAKRVVVMNNIIFALPGWIADLTGTIFFFKMAASYTASYSGYKPSGFPGTATFAALILLFQLIAVPFLIYFTQTADVWQWLVRAVFTKMGKMCDINSAGDFECGWKATLSVVFGFVHFITAFCVLIIAGVIGGGGPPFDKATGIGSKGALIVGMTMFGRIMCGAAYVWWVTDPDDGFERSDVARHYGYLGSLAKIYYSTIQAEGNEIYLSDTSSMMAGSGSSYVAPNLVKTTTFAMAQSKDPSQNSYSLPLAFPVWRMTWVMAAIHGVFAGLIVWGTAISPF